MISHGSYCGLYINLDRSLERRHRFETQLAELGLDHRYARFPAVDGKVLNFSGSPLDPNDVGVFLSHHRALEHGRKAGKCVHILEDGAVLSRHVASVIEDAVAANLFERYDILFTDMMVHAEFGFLKSLKTAFDEARGSQTGRLRLNQLRLVNLIHGPNAALQSYVVGAGAIDRLLALYRREVSTGLKSPVDGFIQQQVLAGRLRAACVFPFITSFRLDDIPHDRMDRPSVRDMAAQRYSFYLGWDGEQARRIHDAAPWPSRKAPGFALSEDFVAP